VDHTAQGHVELIAEQPVVHVPLQLRAWRR